MSTYKEIEFEESAPKSVLEVEIEDITDDPQLDDQAPDDEQDSEDEQEAAEAPAPKKPDDKQRTSRAQKRIKELHAGKRAAEIEAEELRKELAEARKASKTQTASTKTDLKTSLQEQLKSLNKEMVTAIREGEAELVVSLQEEIFDTKQQINGLTYEIERYSQVDEEEDTPPPAAKKGSDVPEKALEWIETYPQFKKDKFFHAAALIINNDLLEEGFDVDSEDFYEELNSRLKPRFPDVFGTAKKNDVKFTDHTSDDDSEDEQEDDKPVAKSSSKASKEQVVSGASRTSSSEIKKGKKSNTVTLSPEDLAQAERWGLSPEQMARRILHAQKNARVDGYVPIEIG